MKSDRNLPCSTELALGKQFSWGNEGDNQILLKTIDRIMASKGATTLLLIICCFVTIRLRADLIVNGSTNVIDGTLVDLSIGATVFIGTNGQNSQLIITNGGILKNGNGIVGYGSNTTFNSAFVSGAGSMWTNSGELWIGNESPGNALVVENGAQMFGVPPYLGYTTNASNNLLLVTGTNSLVKGRNIQVGAASAGNRLIVSNGASAFFGQLDIGILPKDGNQNMIVVTDPGSSLISDGGVYLGSGGSSNNWLIISNGGFVSNTTCLIGGFSGAIRSNTVVVTGQNSRWILRDEFWVSDGGSGQKLEILNGAVVENDYVAYIAIGTTASNNSVFVSGANSQWKINGPLLIGSGGKSNSVVIANGGTISNSFGYIGLYPAAYGNSVAVTGMGSVWTNSRGLFVGSTGAVSQLFIGDGGLVAATNLIVGAADTATNNRIVVSNATLRITNFFRTGSLDIRRGTNFFLGGSIRANNLLLTNADGSFEFSAGVLNIRTSRVDNGRCFIVGAGSSPAELQLDNADTNSYHVFAQGLLVQSNSALSGGGTIIGSITNFGATSLGPTNSSLNIAGNLTLGPMSTTSLKIGGRNAGTTYDQIVVSSNADLNGEIRIQLNGNFLPSPWHQFVLMRFDSSTGSFANLTNGTLALENGLATFAITQTTTNIYLHDVTYVDSDGDGQGDLQELAAGTNPNDPTTFFRIISITKDSSGQNIVQFESAPGKVYRVQYSGNLSTWFTATSNLASGGSVTEWVDDGSLTGGLSFSRRYFRITLK